VKFFTDGENPVIDKVPNELGRWPANLIHDGSDEVVALFPDSKGQLAGVGPKNGDKSSVNTYGDYGPRNDFPPRGDAGSAARFFYCAKTSKKDRNEGLENEPDRILAMSNQAKAELERGNMHEGNSGFDTAKIYKNNHPTVKPTELMRYLCRLVTPPGGTVLDPFMGSGSTGKAAMLEGFKFVGIEMDESYHTIAKARIEAALVSTFADMI
jgi:site-specific DNA-methyltransferase (adenine-specific)